jgi:hypothetical protein
MGKLCGPKQLTTDAPSDRKKNKAAGLRTATTPAPGFEAYDGKSNFLEYVSRANKMSVTACWELLLRAAHEHFGGSPPLSIRSNDAPLIFHEASHQESSAFPALGAYPGSQMDHDLSLPTLSIVPNDLPLHFNQTSHQVSSAFPAPDANQFPGQPMDHGHLHPTWSNLAHYDALPAAPPLEGVGNTTPSPRIPSPARVTFLSRKRVNFDSYPPLLA